MSEDRKLPEDFADLAPYHEWSLGNADLRQLKRRNSNTAQMQAFYDAILPRIEDILAAVDNFKLGELPEEYRGLYDMALSLAEIAPHVELYKGDPSVPYAFEESRMIAVHGQHATWLGKAPSAQA